ncbi:Uncharacterised protein [Mycobacteroides abscessus subsp. abscessus]|nr:Uncharacterised protein [Mycobacteroides abscessus subsp. abscessus]
MHQRLAWMLGDGRRGRDAANQVGRPTHKVFRGPHVSPVTGVDVPTHLGSTAQQTREYLPLNRNRPTRRDLLNQLTPEDVTTGVDLISGRVFGLLEECGNLAVGIGRYTTECAWIADAYQMQGQISLGLFMLCEKIFQIQAGEHIAIEDQRGVVSQMVQHISDGTAGTQRLLFVHIGDL